ncbi:MAG TPA: bifunctional phosphoglucose/phosphomannose isomerase [Thermoanaerobacterales bacterium]|jgi:glucose/mannose-6-phosphate isomerase|nr:bifunctional phosphoglucose/phosphomannose isomerase [Thermoanaerobacterales bacterium]
MLDNLNQIQELDKGGMFDLIYKFPDHCAEAIKIARESIRGLRFHNIINVVITGLGGSAIGGDLIRMITADRAQIPIIINRDYNLPAFVDERTLVVTSSYSGNTEETLTAYEHAKNKKAKIMVITTGGELKKKAMADETPIITIPEGLPPRAALGFSFFPLFVLFQEQGIGYRKQFDVENALSLLKDTRTKYCPEVVEEYNPTKSLARKLYGKIPLVYGSSSLTDIIAVRWKGQLNENSKHPAFFNVFPELNHNEIMGFEGDSKLLKLLEIVILRSPYESDRIKKRIDITMDILQDQVSGITELWPKGESVLEHMLYHIMFGDYVSAYLAILNRKDPKEIDFIDELKERMQA